MIQTVDYADFVNAFRDMGRADNFSQKGLGSLYRSLVQYEDETGEQLELDVIGLCCDFTEDKLEIVLSDYELDSIDELRDATTVITVDSETVIYGVF